MRLGRAKIEFELANSPDVDSDPPIEIEIFRPVRAGICYRVSLANLLEATGSIVSMTRFVSKREAVRRASSLSVCFLALANALAVDQFSYFVAKSHRSHLVAERNNFN